MDATPKSFGSDPEHLRIAFCHPDLGLGGTVCNVPCIYMYNVSYGITIVGAERLIVDAATELGQRGHSVDVYTAYYDEHRCFEETKSGDFAVLVRGGYFPRSIGGRAMALCAYIRCMLMAWSLCLAHIVGGTSYDVVIVDQVSIAIIILKIFYPRTRILFYCHFPDLLLSSPKSLLHRMYRTPLNAMEQWSTGMAHRVLVNSEYTKSIFKETFQSLDRRGIVPDVLYPAVSIPTDEALHKASVSCLPDEAVALLDSRTTFLSINRYERKKNIGLAIRALALVGKDASGRLPGLIVAGGYDVRLQENVEHLQELQKLAEECRVDDRVVFIKSFSDEQRLALLCACRAVLYTPTNEHFGIVPVEAMASATPVIACNSGGPKESVLDGVTGFLKSPDPIEFAKGMRDCLGDVRIMGSDARKRVFSIFSRKSFGATLESILRDMVSAKRPSKKED